MLSIVVGLLVISLLYYRPSSPHAYSRHIHHHDPHSRPACDPYHSYGHIIVDPEVPENNIYRPFDKSCKAPQLFRAFREKLGKTSALAPKLTGWGGKGEDIEYVRGKTVLMIGDSTVREQLVQFCGVSSPPTNVRPYAFSKLTDSSRPTAHRPGASDPLRVGRACAG